MTVVGVVVPAFNPGPVLRRALDSVIAQTFVDWRAIVVDDGSAEDLDWVATLDPRIVLRRQENAGVSRARNVGVAALDTPLIAFLDQDDEWCPRKLELQVAALDAAPEAPFCHAEFIWVLPGKRIPGKYSEPITYNGLLSHQHVLLSSVLVRRERYLAAGGHDPLLEMVQDYDLFLRLTLDGSRPACVHQPLVKYYVHDANASRDYRRAHDEGVRVIGAHAQRARRTGNHSAVEAARSGVKRARRLYADQALQSYRSSPSRLKGIGHLTRAFGWDPTGSIRTAAAAVRSRLKTADPDENG